MTEKKLTRAEIGRKGGSATGPQKSWVLKMPPEERSEYMRALVQKRFAKKQEGQG